MSLEHEMNIFDFGNAQTGPTEVWQLTLSVVGKLGNAQYCGQLYVCMQ